MSPEPKPVTYAEEELKLAAALGMTTGQIQTIKLCPACECYIIPCDNGVWLDAKRASEDSVVAMGVMEVGAHRLAVGGDVHGSLHELHEHQPEEVSDGQ